MNREDIIAMAREAGMRPNMTEALLPDLERFAALIAAASASVEREACIDLVAPALWSASVDLEAAIRARGQA